MKFNKHLQVATSAAVEAGKILLSYQKKLKTSEVEVKKSLGLVTKADVLSEKKIKSILLTEFKNSIFLGEEENYQSKSDLSNEKDLYKNYEFTWVVDPLDGTTNFVHQLECYSVCIGLLHFGKPVLGVVYLPSSGNLYIASQGSGSFKKNLLAKNKRSQRLWVEGDKKLKDSLLATGFATEKGKVYEKEFALFLN